MPDRVIWLSVGESGSSSESIFSWHVRLDGVVLASNLALCPEQSQAVRDMALRYSQLFEVQQLPEVAKQEIAAIGAQLFEYWLAPCWDRLDSQLQRNDRRLLVVGSDRPSILNLPWELLQPKEGTAIGADGKWSVRRSPWRDRPLGAANESLPAGPLRVLYMVSAPNDQVELDHEREEELLLRALNQAGRLVVFDSGDLGSFEELGERITAFRPHVVHLTGHGVAGVSDACFAFEDERGGTDERSAAELGQLFAGSDVQCAFLSTCEGGKAPSRAALGGLAQGLVAEGVPLVISWAASVLDDVATQVASSFYKAVASGQSTVDRALAISRQAVRPMCEARGDASWSLAVLYAGTAQGQLFDARRDEPVSRPSLVLRPLPGMVEGYTPSFIGRRHEQQQLLPRLRSGDLQLVVLTGIGGAGKSTLATHLARKLEPNGWTPVAIPSSPGMPLTAAQLLEVCGGAFLRAGQHEVYGILRNGSLPVPDRLHTMVYGLNQGRFVLVLDNFECNLDEATRQILDPELAEFYRYMLAHLSGNSRLLVTSRYLPAEVAPLPPTATEWRLGEFPEASFLKFLLRDEVVERRYRTGDLGHELLLRLHRVLGATPRFVAQIRQVLAELPAAELEAELERVELPDEDEAVAGSNRLQLARDTYCEAIFTERLYGRLSPEAQRMLSRVAVLGLPVPLEGLVACAGAELANVQRAAAQWRAAALVQVTGSRGYELWSVYGLLRSWLTTPARLLAEERRKAQLAAGDYLVELARQDRAGEFGLSDILCTLEARALYLAAADLDRARLVTSVLCDLYVRQGLFGEVERLNRELLKYEEHPATLNWIGKSYVSRGKYELARQVYNRATDLAELDNPASARTSMQALASINLHEGDFDAARKAFQRVLDVQKQIGDHEGEASTWHNLASIDVSQGAYPAAREKLLRALGVKRQRDEDKALSWSNLGHLDIEEGAYPAARKKIRRALDLWNKVGDLAGKAIAWHQLGSIDLLQGAYDDARNKLQRSLAIRQQIGDVAGEAATRHQLASICLDEGAHSAAREEFNCALALYQKVGNRKGEADTLQMLAVVDLEQADYGAAREGLLRALKMRQEIGDRQGEADTWLYLGKVAFRLGRSDTGLCSSALCYLINREIGHYRAEGDWRMITQQAAQLGYSPEQFDVKLRETAKQYALDRGAMLLTAIVS